MALQPFVLKAPELQDYCVDLRQKESVLGAAFSHSNSVKLWDVANFNSHISVTIPIQTNLNEFTFIDTNTLAVCDASGHVIVHDIRSNTSSKPIKQNEELYSIDCNGMYIATGGDKSTSVW
jgi:WD40 repeat protein